MGPAHGVQPSSAFLFRLFNNAVDFRATALMPRSLRELPKCELHVHLEGAMRIETLSELCAKHSIAEPEDTRGKMYNNFDAFACAYRAACECLRERADVFRVVREHLEDAVAAGCAWVEVAPSLLLWCQRFDGLESTVLLLLEAAAAAEDAVGGKAACAYVFSAERHEPPENAEALATVVGAIVTSGRHMIHGRAGIVGFGLHSAEPGNPPAPFAKAFRIAAAAGLSAMPHAGELAPGGGISGADLSHCLIPALALTPTLTPAPTLTLTLTRGPTC